MSLLISFMRFVDGTDKVIVDVKPDESSNLQKKLLGNIVATLSFQLNGIYNFNIGDYADILGTRYYISKPPIVTKQSRFNYVYVVTMETIQRDLKNTKYLFFDATNTLAQSDFSLTGTADDFINLVMFNMARKGGGWLKGGVIATNYQTITFENDNCATALAKIASVFETEFYVDGLTIHLAKKQRPTGLSLFYGKNKGLYNITRDLADEEILTKLFVYGGNQNLPLAYRNFSPRLLLNSVSTCHVTDLSATVVTDTLKHFTFNFTLPASTEITGLDILYRAHGSSDTWITDSGAMVSPRTLDLPLGNYDFKFVTVGGPCTGADTTEANIDATTTQLLFQEKSILYNNTDKYGTIEGSVIFEDIVPEREGVVTSVDGTNVYKFVDTNVEFDINNYLLPGITPKIVFNTGQLAGYKFDISNFNNSTKTFTILKNKDERAIDVPSAAFKPAIGDKYILIDLLLPQVYIADAEKRLRVKATEYLNLKSDAIYKYTVQCDIAFFRKNSITLDVGDIIHLTDVELQIDKNIRIITLTQSLKDEFEVTIELGDTITKSALQSIQAAIAANSSKTQSATQKLNNSAIFNGTYIGNFKVLQGTTIIPDMPIADSVSGMKQLYIDSDGNIWKAP